MDELDTHPDFQLLLLDKKTALSELARNSQTLEIGHTLHNGEERSIQTKIKKKDKMKMRKELLQKKIHVIKLLKDEEKGKLLMTPNLATIFLLKTCGILSNYP